MLPNIIAICGAKRSGKDVLADHLTESYGYTKIKFADILKKAISILFDFTDEQLGDGDLKDVIDKRWQVTPRQVLQFFGTEVLQHKLQEILPNIGKKFLVLSLLSKLNENHKYVISDLRFLHEYEELRKLNAFVIRMDRPDYISYENHISEKEYKSIPYDIKIINDKDISNIACQFNKQFIYAS